VDDLAILKINAPASTLGRREVNDLVGVVQALQLNDVEHRQPGERGGEKTGVAAGLCRERGAAIARQPGYRKEMNRLFHETHHPIRFRLVPIFGQRLRGHDDHAGGRILDADIRDEINPGAVRQIHVQQDNAWNLLGQPECFGAGGGFRHTISGALKNPASGVPGGRIIIYVKNRLQHCKTPTLQR